MQTFHTGGAPPDVSTVKRLLVRSPVDDVGKIMRELFAIYGKSVAAVHFEVLLRAAQRWGGQKRKLSTAARDVSRRGWLAVASFERLRATLKKLMREASPPQDKLRSPKTRVVLGQAINPVIGRS